MQTHEFVESVQHGFRLPHADQDSPAQRATPETRAEWLGADGPRYADAMQPAHMPRSYGAGF